MTDQPGWLRRRKYSHLKWWLTWAFNIRRTALIREVKRAWQFKPHIHKKQKTIGFTQTGLYLELQVHTSMTPNQSRQGPQRTCVRYPTSVHEGSWVQRRQVTFKLVSLGKADMIYTWWSVPICAQVSCTEGTGEDSINHGTETVTSPSEL